MSRTQRNENEFTHKEESNSFEQVLINTDKIALVDADILFHKAMAAFYNEENPSLQDCLAEIEKKVNDFESTLVSSKGYIYFIKGRGNFRYTVATMKPYKGTRVSEPFKFYDQMYEHFKLYRDCIVCNFKEADDMLSIFHDHRTIACTTDKDANQNPGDIYNFTKREIKTLSEEEAWWNLWKQVLTGDTVDNIPGLEGCGPTMAEKILNYGAEKASLKKSDFVKLGISDDFRIDPKTYPNEVLNAYILKYGVLTGSDFFNENYQLIRMKSSAGAYIKEAHKDIFSLIDLLHEM